MRKSGNTILPFYNLTIKDPLSRYNAPGGFLLNGYGLIRLAMLLSVAAKI